MEKTETDFDKLIDKQFLGGELRTIEDRVRILYRVFDLLIPLKDSRAALDRIEEISRRLKLRSSSLLVIEDYRRFLKASESQAKKALLD